ncbi:MAG TPA: ATP-dependent DNA helicase RecG [Rickettsiales bacterium]|nr:ATP-dependent DNA helicase RecG [Rickettsiales bacterium]
MRPDKLFSLFSDITRLNGVGPGAKKALARLFGKNEFGRILIRDLVFHLPVSVIDRRHTPPLHEAKEGDIVSLIVTVETHQPSERRGGKKPYKVICHTAEGYITLVFFHARPDYIKSMLPVGAQKAVSGKLERYGQAPQITHPDIIAPAGDLQKIMSLETVYGLTYGLTNRHLCKIIQSALQLLPDMPEWLDMHHLQSKHWKDWKTSLLAVHNPHVPEELLPLSPARERLAYDEILANQLALALVRNRLRRKLTEPMPALFTLRNKVSSTLPYSLTQGQQKVLAEIDEDLCSGTRMLRLLQGDVGSGKTVVALMAMLRAVEAGGQAALMVPTELLGRQHFAFLERYAKPAGVRISLLTGSLKTKEHEAVLAKIAAGETDIVIGTHALFQDKVVFKNLALAVIDEQHRFGVAQRLALTGKAKDTHVLVMTATPIPRTLTMTAFGDMDCSILAEKPAGRLEITTKAIPISRSEDVLQGIERTIAKGEKVYWICPLVEESDDENVPSDLAAAEAKYIEFTHRFKGRAGMAHGRMKAEERDAVMSGFAGSQYDILVATTVVEVGVDVPDATVIVIEHAERFGLAQLHQLRGRVGRSDKQSSCILLYTDECNDIAKSRLRIIRETNDGFRIAEEDMRLRGSGDILGTRQSGMMEFHFADLLQNQELLYAAHQDVKLILHNDAELKSARGEALKCLLYLFGYDENIRFLNAG